MATLLAWLLTPMVAGAATCTTAPAGLVSWWRAEGNALDAADGNHGTLQGGTSFVAGEAGQAFSFNGTDAAVQIPASSNLNVGLGSGLTLETWIKPDDVSAQQPIFEWQADSGPGGHAVHFWIAVASSGGGSGSIYLNVVDTSFNFHPLSTGPGLLTTNAYQHVAATYDKASGVAVIYLNGSAVTNLNLGTFTPRTSPDLYLAYRPTGGSAGTRFKGAIDEPSIYGRALSAAEIQAIYTASSAGKCPSGSPACAPLPSGLVSWWRAESNALDQVGGNNGTPVGGLGYVTGKVRQAFQFNGTDAGITVASNATLDVGLGAGLTVELWMKPASVSTEKPIFEWNTLSGVYPFGVHLEMAVPALGGGSGSLWANVVDNTGHAQEFSTTTGLLTAGVWQHVALTYDKAGGVARVYLNGVEVTNKLLGTFTPRTAANFYLGWRPAGGGSGARFSGSMDEPSVYNRALSTAEIVAIYQADAAGKCVTLTPPVITQQPADVSVPVGGTAQFNVQAAGTPPFAYQWRFMGADISGATNSSLVLSNVQTNQSGPYSVIVSNGVGSTNSSSATLTVSIPTCTPAPSGLVSWWRGEIDALDSADGNSGVLVGPVAFATGKVGEAFLFNGSNTTVRFPASPGLNVGTNGGFSVEAWVNPTDVARRDPIVEWNNGAGTFGTHFYVIDIPTGPGNLYADLKDTSGASHVFYAGAGTIASNLWQHVALTYDKATGIGRLYRNGIVVAQQTLGAFTPQTTYDLYLGRRPTGDVLISFAGKIDEPTLYNRALTTAEVQAIYQADTAGKCVAATVPVITQQPANTSVFVGGTAQFNVQATGTSPFAFQWRFMGGDISGATNASLVLTNVQANQGGPYSVVVSNAAGSTNSSDATLTVSLLTCAPPPTGLVSWWRGEGSPQDEVGGNHGTNVGGLSYAAGKVGQGFNFDGVDDGLQVAPSSGLNLGTNVGLTIECWIKPAMAGGLQPLVEWEAGGAVGVQLWYQNIPGPGSFDVNIRDIAGNDHILDAVGVITTNGFQHVAVTYDKASGTATLYYNGAPVVTQNVGTFTPQTGAGYGLFVGRRPPLNGGPAYLFKGLIDELSLYSRALTTAEILAISQADTAGKCVSATAPVITQQPASTSVFVGGTAQFSVQAAGTSPIAYQWRFMGADISGATSSSLTLTNVQTNLAGPYSVFVSNSAGATNSSSALLTVTMPTCAPPPAGLISWWRGEGDAQDEVGGNHAATVGGLGYAAGKVGQGFSFDGVDDGLQVASSPGLNVGTNAGMTIECWIKPTTAGGLQPLVEWESGGAVGVQWWYQDVPGAGTLDINFRDVGGTNHILSAVGVITTNGFQHVAAVYDKASGTATLYYNGVPVAAQNFGTFTPQTGGTYGLFVGRRPPLNGGPAYQFKGLIDELSLYRRALTPAEIQAIYQADSAGKCVGPIPPLITQQPANTSAFIGGTAQFSVQIEGTSPIAYQWRFMGSEISGATNSSLTLTNVQTNQAGPYSVLVSNAAGSTNSSDATLTVNVPVCVTHPTGLVSWWAGEGDAGDQIGNNTGQLLGTVGFPVGKVGQAFQFNGTNSAVRIPASASLDVGAGGGLTLEAWIKPDDLTAQRPIFEWQADTGPGGYAVHFWIAVPAPNGGGPGSLYVNFVDTSFALHYFATAGGILTTNSYQHVAATYDKASGIAVIYLNGVAVATQSLGTFTPRTGVDLYLGLRPTGAPAGTRWVGSIDEPSIYNRALSAAEIQSLYNADNAGKCPPTDPPTILTQPQGVSVVRGGQATFNVSVTGASPLTYQWKFGGSNLVGATNGSLVLTNVQTNQAGPYSVVVANAFGSTNSSTATLTVTNPPANIRISSANGVAGGSVTVPVLLVANGNENSLGFSLNYNAAVLSFTSATLGSGASGAALLLNPSQTNVGKLGLGVGLQPGATFAAGTQQVLNVAFAIAPVPNATNTTISFGDVPIGRQLSDAATAVLPATYSSGVVTIAATDFEGDVSPRPTGNRGVTITDWVQVGRFAAGLDTVSNGSEFQRADCAPRSSLGNGNITLTDYVQAGRYAAGLDPLTPVGGPGSFAAGPVAAAKSQSAAAVGRTVKLGNATLQPGQTTSVQLQLVGTGDENALSASVRFDPLVVRFVGASAGSGAAGASLLVNPNDLGSGRVGLVLALATGSTFAAGAQQVVTLDFAMLPGATGRSSLALDDQPVLRLLSDRLANELSASFEDSVLTLNGDKPTLSIVRNADTVDLSWPITAAGFTLESLAGVAGVANWTNVATPPSVAGQSNVVTLPASEPQQFFRLRTP